jgi:hypothetical protein
MCMIIGAEAQVSSATKCTLLLNTQRLRSTSVMCACCTVCLQSRASTIEANSIVRDI